MGDLSFNRAWLSRLWPFEVARQITPQDLSEILRILWGNRTALSYVWKILNHGICDGCSLGASGLRDDLLGGVHFCMARLRLLQLHTMKPFDLSLVSDIGRLARMAPDELPALGRLGYPLIRRKDERGFLRISWDEALDVARAAIRAAGPHELAFLATSQGLTNEVYYIMQKLARVLGSNNVDLCSRVAHGASVAPLQATLLPVVSVVADANDPEGAASLHVAATEALPVTLLPTVFVTARVSDIAATMPAVVRVAVDTRLAKTEPAALSL